MTLEIKRVKLDDIHQDPANARKHGQRNLEAIRGSLRPVLNLTLLIATSS